jgi:hypothetical protein
MNLMKWQIQPRAVAPRNLDPDHATSLDGLRPQSLYVLPNAYY